MKNGNGGDILALGENSFRPELLFDDELLELRKNILETIIKIIMVYQILP